MVLASGGRTVEHHGYQALAMGRPELLHQLSQPLVHEWVLTNCRRRRRPRNRRRQTRRSRRPNRIHQNLRCRGRRRPTSLPEGGPPASRRLSRKPPPQPPRKPPPEPNPPNPPLPRPPPPNTPPRRRPASKPPPLPPPEPRGPLAPARRNQNSMAIPPRISGHGIELEVVGRMVRGRLTVKVTFLACAMASPMVCASAIMASPYCCSRNAGAISRRMPPVRPSGRMGSNP